MANDASPMIEEARAGVGEIVQIENLRRVLGEPAVHRPRGRSKSDGVLLSVLDMWLARKSWRQIAVQLYGAKRVAEGWSTESPMRSRVRRLGKKARFLMESGYRDLAAGR